MLFFVNDYGEGCHKEILEKLLETNMEKTPGYGVDEYCKSAEEKIKKACGCPEAQVYFLVGGTQTNMVTIDALTETYGGVVAADTGHVNVHEAGAIEHSGHKVLTLTNHEGKIRAGELLAYIERFYKDPSFDHMVFPGIVYISHPTEVGTLYTKNELKGLHEVCEKFNIPLYLDGARLGYGLAAKGTDVTLKDIAEYTDVFYIGGTKAGALFGEALVFTKNNMPKHFNTIVKQRGAMVAKGRMLGIQFDTLFTDDLYMKGAKNGIETAERLKQALKDKNYEFFIESPTNQIFVIIDKETEKRFEGKVKFDYWEYLGDGRIVIRFATSWATAMEDVEKLAGIL